jgi:hypothetical protein
VRNSAPGVQRSRQVVVELKRRAVLLLLVTAACLFVAPRAAAQISPGPLSKAHSSLSGTTQCATCHSFGASAPTFKCLECHKELAQALAGSHGYHARLQMQNPNGKDCVRCHLEHNGENYNLIHWEPSREKFDHRLTATTWRGSMRRLHARSATRQPTWFPQTAR